MADKKRKGAVAAAERPPKKSKQAVEESAVVVPPPVKSAIVTAPANDTAVKSKTRRKRAADFLDDTNENVPTSVIESEKSENSKKKAKQSQPTSAASVASKKGKKNNKAAVDTSLTADGVNGVVEHNSDSEVEIATGDVPVETSLTAEALRTADKELDDEFGEGDSEVDDADQGAALLAGFDSDTEDKAEDINLDLSRTQPIPDYKKTSKKLRKAKENGSSGPGTVYVGRIPHGFYEQPMREYFNQFGDIKRLRLSRNKRTGASKHFAFIEFESDEVARIVAETMDNYLMFGHILKCKYAPAENLHPDIWKGANKKFRKIPHEKLERQKLQEPKTVEQWEKKNQKEQKKRDKKAEKLKGIGYEFISPKLTDPSTVLEARQLEESKSEDAITNGDEPVAAIEDTKPEPEAVVSKKQKKDKKKPVADATVKPLTEDNLDAQNEDIASDTVVNGKKKKKSAKTNTATSTVAATHAGSSITPDESTNKKRKKVAKALSTVPSTDKGDYDNLSSVAMGADAAAEVPSAPMPEVDLGSLEQVSGVADTELKQRKKDRKASKGKAEVAPSSTEEKVTEIAPAAVKAGKKEKKDKKDKDQSKSKADTAVLPEIETPVAGANVGKPKEKKLKSILKKDTKKKA